MELLTLENIKSKKPKEMHGDLHISNEGIYFLAFRKVNNLIVALQMNFGLLGYWFTYRSEKKRENEMAQWRIDHGGKFLDELVKELPDSWMILKDQIESIKPGFMGMGLNIKHLDGKKFSLEMKKEQSTQIMDFIHQENWPVLNQ
ncbi:MAG: hypothetical protein ACYTBP_13120 [Planctomycetota bacterium]|jgi:hypothetical protein